MVRFILILGALFLCSCDGTTGVNVDGSDPETKSEKEGTDPETDPGEIVPAFNHEKNDLKLLPFHIRLRKLSAVVGLPDSDPVFALVRSNRFSLGDHNYGDNIGPDLNWNASKMALWVRSIQPICDSTEMIDRYPTLPGDLDEFWLAAHSREITEEERTEITALDLSNLDAPGQYRAICISVLTSAEFVGQ